MRKIAFITTCTVVIFFFSYSHDWSKIDDLELCQQAKKEMIQMKSLVSFHTYLAPEVLSVEPYTKESNFYSFGMISMGKKSFYNRSHNHGLTWTYWKEKDLK